MPIEIRELIIKTSVVNKPGSRPNTKLDKNTIRLLKRDILDACKDEIEKAIRRKLER